MTKSQISQISAIVEAVVAALEQQDAPKPKPKAPKVSKPKAVRPVVKMTPKVSKRSKAENKTLYRMVQGKIGAATKASTKVKARGFLKEAMSLTPEGWTAVQNQIVRKHAALAL